MKKLAAIFLVAIILTLVLIMSLHGTSAEGTVGIAMPTQSLQRWNQDGANMKAALEEAGYSVNLQYANNDIATQVAQIENMLVSGAQVLIVAPIDGGVLDVVLGMAKDTGVPVIAYDRLLTGTENVDYYTTFDNYGVGVIQGQ
ncbi:MAG: substrate-binding domain-containing protein, partial [Eubacteriales bacterium]|nr:substrate-binding domain-containing protein [Eubacteriales bacterium]